MTDGIVKPAAGQEPESGLVQDLLGSGDQSVPLDSNQASNAAPRMLKPSKSCPPRDGSSTASTDDRPVITSA